jgi:hypothetical protein
MRGLFLLCSICCITTFSNAQTAKDTLRYVDFHIHTAFKNYYRSVPHPDRMNDPQFRESIKDIQWTGKPTVAVTNFVGFSGVDGKTAYNQATFDVLDNSPPSFLCTSFYSIEKQTAQDVVVPIKMGGFEKFMAHIFSWFNNEDAKFFVKKKFKPTILDVNVFKVLQMNEARLRLYQNKDFTNFYELQQQIRFIDEQTKNKPAQFLRPVFFVRDRIQLDSILNVRFEKGPVLLFNCIEGGHNFYGLQSSAINDVKTVKCDGDCESEIFSNIRTIKNGSHHLFFVTLAHLFWNKMAGFARGLDVNNEGLRSKLANAMWDKKFSAVDGKDAEGIIDSALVLDTAKVLCDPAYKRDPITNKFVYLKQSNRFGYRIIDSLLSTENIYGRPSYIDMRHMDVQARHDCIKYITTYYKDKNIPLLISHAAASGKDEKLAMAMGLSPIFDDYKEFINPRNFYRKQFVKNHAVAKCWQGKLHFTNGDEYVKELIKKSGWFHPMSSNLYDEEIAQVVASDGIIGITMEERALGTNAYNYRHVSKQDQIAGYFSRNYTVRHGHFAYYNGDEDDLLDSLKIGEPFVRNLFYIVENSGEYGNIKSWEHISIGSDFDGIMDPIDICPTTADIPGFYEFLVHNLEFYAEYLQKEKTKLFVGKSPEELLNMVFYQNGERFIKKYF